MTAPRDPIEAPATEHDPDCLLLDKNHDGPHMVRPDHPKIRLTPQTYECSACDYVMWDAALGDVEDHWRDAHRAEAAQGAAPRAEGLDVERLIEAAHQCDVFLKTEVAQGIAAEYARLRSESDR